MEDGRITIGTKIDEKGFSSSLNRIEKKIQSFGNSTTLKALSNIGNSITGVLSGYKIVTDSIKMATAAVKEMSEAYKTQKTAETALTQAAKNNPYLLSESVQHLKDYASELQSISTYGDEELLPYMAQLASAGRTEQEIMDIMSASIDVAASGSMSLDSAVRNLNKTFSGLSGELGEANPQIKALSAEQLKNGEAVKVLAKQYDGMAQEVAKATGSNQQLKNAVGDLKEELGAPFEKAMSPVRAFFTELIGGWTNALKKKREYNESGKKISAGSAGSADIETRINGLYENRKKLIDDTVSRYGNMITEKQAEDLNKKKLAQIDAEIAKDKELLETIKKLEEEESKRKQTEEENAKKAADLKEEQDARDKQRAAYDETLRQKQEEINQRRTTGEEISAEAEAQEMYNTAFSAYVKMMSDPAFKGNSGNFSHEVDARSQIADWGKIAGGGELKKQIEEFEKELEKAADEAAGIVKNHYDSLLESLDEEYNAVIENKYLEEEEKTRIQEEFAEKRKAIEEAAAKADKDAITEKIDSITGINENYWSQYKAKIDELSKLEAEVENSTVLDHKEKEAEKTRITEAATQARKELIARIAGDVANYTSQAVQIMQDASNLMLDTVKNEATAEQAELETKYRKGEISEEEYNEKVTESKKKAAKEQYKIQMVQWSASILQATANIAQGVTQAIAQGGVAGLITGSLVAAAGAVQIASIIASKPTPPNFAGGGVIGGMNGASMGADNTYIHARTGEMVVNAAQQKALWEAMNGGANGAGGANIVINNSAANIATAQPKLTRDKIEIMIDARVNDSMRRGRYDQSMSEAQAGMTGDYYGI